jgi:hypothetical protein
VAAPSTKPIRDPSRRQRFASLRAALAETEVGRDFDLSRLHTLADFQAWVPLLDAEAHSARVTAKLGFDLPDLPESELGAGERDRAELITIWQQRLRAAGGEGRVPQRIALLHAPADDPLIDRLRLDDLAALAPGLALLRIHSLDADPGEQIEALRRFRPDTLVMPSLATCSWLEGVMRTPIERHLDGLRWLFAESDLDQRVRTRLPVINAGWIHGAGRMALPTRRSPWQGFSLATRSLLIELLPHGDPEVDPRQRVQDRLTVLPENSILGERYELVLSSPLGFLRLRSGHHVRVVGFVPPPDGGEDTLPRPRVIRLPPPPADISLEGVTLAGAWLTASVRQAFNREDPALVAGEIAADPRDDPRDRSGSGRLEPFVDTELGASRAGARDRGPKPRALVVRVEVQGQTDHAFAPRLARRIDDDLRSRSAAYEWLRGRGELWELQVVVAEPGMARRARDRRIRGLGGPVERPTVRVRLHP